MQKTISISVFGLGYVGSVTAGCLASRGWRVTGVDPNPLKVEQMAAGRPPIVEPGLAELLETAHASGLLTATANAAEAVVNSDFSFISVGTPSQHNGKLDLTHIEKVCAEIGDALRTKSAHHTIVVRSTVLPGTCRSMVTPILEKNSGKRAGVDFSVCFNPEFLREGSAVADFFEPTFTVIGGGSDAEIARARELYAWVPGRLFETTLEAAEMVKYVCNAYHAVKVAFANEIGAICKQLNVDAAAVTEMFTADTRLNISKAYLTPGFAFGGSCLPKDLRALTYCSRGLDLKLPLLEHVMGSNEEHINRAVEQVLRTGLRKVGVLGLSFKTGTDDLRESPMVHVVKRLLGEGCQLEIWDSHVSIGRLIGSNRQFIEDTIPHIGSLLREDVDGVIQNCEVLLLATSGFGREDILRRMRPGQVLIDVIRAVPTLTKPLAATTTS